MFISFHKSLLLPRQSSDLIYDFCDLLHTEFKEKKRRGERRGEGGRKERKARRVRGGRRGERYHTSLSFYPYYVRKGKQHR